MIGRGFFIKSNFYSPIQLASINNVDLKILEDKAPTMDA